MTDRRKSKSLVKKSVSQYKKTYKDLERYDKGLIKSAKDILGIKRLQAAIRRFS